jgi:hypothetical protein
LVVIDGINYKWIWKVHNNMIMFANI